MIILRRKTLINIIILTCCRLKSNNFDTIDLLFIKMFQAEARLAARRQARAEAREIRMREIERQQKEAEENADKAFDMYAAGKYII